MKKSNKSLVSSPLLFKEWQNAKWILIIMSWFIFLLVICPFILLNSNSQNKYQVANAFESIFIAPDEYFWGIVILIVGLTIMLCSDKKDKKAFLYAMPFNRIQIIFNKLLIGIFTIAGALLLNYLIIISLYFLNLSSLSGQVTIYQIFNNFTKEISGYLLIFSYLMLIQTLTNNRFFGLIFSIFILVFFIPFSVVTDFSIFGAITALVIDTIIDKSLFILDFLLQINNYFVCFINFIISNSLAQLILALVLYIGTICLYERAKGEKSEGLIIIKPLRKVLKGIIEFSISGTLMLTIYAVFKISNEIILYIFLICIIYIVNFIWNKVSLLIKGRRKGSDIKKSTDIQGMAKY
jgi:hypothetical protein